MHESLPASRGRILSAPRTPESSGRETSKEPGTRTRHEPVARVASRTAAVIAAILILNCILSCTDIIAAGTAGAGVVLYGPEGGASAGSDTDYKDTVCAGLIIVVEEGSDAIHVTIFTSLFSMTPAQNATLVFPVPSGGSAVTVESTDESGLDAMYSLSSFEVVNLEQSGNRWQDRLGVGLREGTIVYSCGMVGTGLSSLAGIFFLENTDSLVGNTGNQDPDDPSKDLSVSQAFRYKSHSVTPPAGTMGQSLASMGLNGTTVGPKGSASLAAVANSGGVIVNATPSAPVAATTRLMLERYCPDTLLFLMNWTRDHRGASYDTSDQAGEILMEMAVAEFNAFLDYQESHHIPENIDTAAYQSLIENAIYNLVMASMGYTPKQGIAVTYTLPAGTVALPLDLLSTWAAVPGNIKIYLVTSSDRSGSVQGGSGDGSATRDAYYEDRHFTLVQNPHLKALNITFEDGSDSGVSGTKSFLNDNGEAVGIGVSMIGFTFLWIILAVIFSIAGRNSRKKQAEAKKLAEARPVNGGKDKDKDKDKDAAGKVGEKGAGPQGKDAISVGSKDEKSKDTADKNRTGDAKDPVKKESTEGITRGMKKWWVLVPLLSPVLSVWAMIIIEYFVTVDDEELVWRAKALDRASFVTVAVSLVFLVIMLFF